VKPSLKPDINSNSSDSNSRIAQSDDLQASSSAPTVVSPRVSTKLPGHLTNDRTADSAINVGRNTYADPAAGRSDALPLNPSGEPRIQIRLPAGSDGQVTLNLDESEVVSTIPEIVQPSLGFLMACAEYGHAWAQTQLGMRYQEGDGVEKSEKWAAYWYQKAAKQGDVDAQFNLGVMYAEGSGVEKDLNLAMYWYHKAADKGHAEAQLSVGKFYENGDGVERDLKQASGWFLKAAEQGNSSAQYNVGLMYNEGKGFEQDSKRAIYWFRKAAKRGDGDACFELGLMYAHGHGVRVDQEESTYWYRKAAERGVVVAQFNLGCRYEKGIGIKKNLERAAYWIKRVAEQGDVDAQFNLGARYTDGDGLEKDLTRAAYWFLAAANQGDARAQVNLAGIYATGKGMEKNPEQAIYWLRKAAAQGKANAKYELGQMYGASVGVEQDFNQAAYWFLEAANQGIKPAQYNLGVMYEMGEGVEQNFEQAVYWQLQGDLKLVANRKNFIFSDYGVDGVLKCLPNVLKKYPEFFGPKKVILKHFGFSQAGFDALDQLIRLDPSIESLVIKVDKNCEPEQVNPLIERLINSLREENTSLIELKFDRIDEALDIQLNQLLEQNKVIGELRLYVSKHPAVNSDDLPLEVLVQVMDKLIIHRIRNGQDKAATQAAVDEFLMGAQYQVLQSDHTRTDKI
jgi:TPR repeat protein